MDDIFREIMQLAIGYSGVSRISVRAGGGGGGAGMGGPNQGEGVGGGRAQSAEAFEEILYLSYEASWFHVHHAVAALQ